MLDLTITAKRFSLPSVTVYLDTAGTRSEGLGSAPCSSGWLTSTGGYAFGPATMRS